MKSDDIFDKKASDDGDISSNISDEKNKIDVNNKNSCGDSNVNDNSDGTIENDSVSDHRIDELISRSEELSEKVKELEEKNLRILAEFDNFRKRTMKEKERMYDSATADCLTPLLSVLDNLERAVSSGPIKTDEQDKSKTDEGIKLIINQFLSELEKMKVVEIESMNKVFDPNCHNAIKTVENKDYGHNMICEVLQKGYRLKDTVIRHAIVVVANP